jgi:hypothetical protein
MKLNSLLGGESMVYESSAYYIIRKNYMARLELELVMISDPILGVRYELEYVEIEC